MIQVDVFEKHKLTLCCFQKKMIVLNDITIKFIGFQLQKNNPRANDFFKAYFNEDDTDLYSFQLKRYNNSQNEDIMKENSLNFIVLQYVEEGQFLNQLEKISFLTFQQILQQLIQAIFQLHQDKILARCICSDNIFIDRQENKIYLFEFGFSPTVNFPAVYKANYDILLVINIMKDLYKRKQGDNVGFENLMKKINNLEIQLQNLNEIQSYLQFYELIQGGPSVNELQNLYTQEWVQTMNYLIQTQDFLSPLPFDNQDPDLTDDDQQKPTKLKLLKLTTKIFQNSYPSHYDQIGLMLRLQIILNDQSIQINQNETIIDKRRIKINQKRLEFYNKYRLQLDKEFLHLIKPNQNEQLDEQTQKEIIKIYKRKTYKRTYKKLFKDKVLRAQQNTIADFTLDEAKICFLLIASLELYEFQDVYKIYQSNDIVDKIQKIQEILKNHIPKKQT